MCVNTINPDMHWWTNWNELYLVWSGHILTVIDLQLSILALFRCYFKVYTVGIQVFCSHFLLKFEIISKLCTIYCTLRYVYVIHLNFIMGGERPKTTPCLPPV